MSKKLIIPLVVIFWGLTITVLAQNPEGGGPMKLTSPAFQQNQMIPPKYTCQGEDVSPPLVVENIPQGTKSLVLIVDDPDAPMGTWVHWVVYNIPVQNTIAEGSVPGHQGSNDFGKVDYGGPCPPSGTHRYFHKIYALDTTLQFSRTPSKRDVEATMKGHILGQAELMGLYKKG